MARYEIDATNAHEAQKALTERVLPEVAPGDEIVFRLDPSKRELKTCIVPEGPWEVDLSCYPVAGAAGAGDIAPPPGGEAPLGTYFPPRDSEGDRIP